MDVVLQTALFCAEIGFQSSKTELRQIQLVVGEHGISSFGGVDETIGLGGGRPIIL